jgi:exopolysaccharide biosynthesis polyprenyl glycosylphosphotransferase
MSSSVGRLPPGLVAKVNLCVDLTLFLVALPASTAISGTISRHYGDLTWFAISGSAVWIVAATSLRHYDPWANRNITDDAALVSVLVMCVTTNLGAIKLFVPSSTSLPNIDNFLLVFWPSVVALRVLVFRALEKREAPLKQVLIIGTGPLGRFTWEDLERRARQRVVGYLRFPDESRCEGIRAGYLGESSNLEQVLRTIAVDEVYIAGNTLRQAEAMQAATRDCERFGLPFALPAYSFTMHRACPARDHAITDGYIHYLSVNEKPGQMALKRLFDIVASAVTLWLLSPVFPLLALAIKVTSRGTILFKQVRVGLNGKPFHMLKFRSMVVNAEELRETLESHNEQSGPVFKIKRDPRITAIGRWMRKYSIDELPQLINVLRGEMSVVGPRPPVPSEVAQYEPWQRRRLSVRPGLTCIWQVSGRNQISFERWMYLDLQYIDHWSLIRDFNLIFKTVPVVMTGRGAS